MKKLIVFLAIFAGQFSRAEKDAAGNVVNPISANTLSTQELIAKLTEYNQLAQVIGEIYAASTSVNYAAIAGKNENPNSQSSDVWYHIFRIRRLNVDSITTNLKNRLPGNLDLTTKILIESALDSVLAEGTRPKQGDANYWFDQITRYQAKCEETTRTLKTAADLLTKKVESIRDQIVGLMRKILDNPAGIPDTLKALYTEQMEALKKIEAAYALKKAEFEKTHEEQRVALETEAASRRAKLETMLSEKQAKGEADIKTNLEKITAEQTTKNQQADAASKKKITDAEVASAKKVADLEADYAGKKTKYDLELKTLSDNIATSNQNLKKIREETAQFVAQAAAAQKKLTETETTIRALIEKLRPSTAGGGIVVKSTDSTYTAAITSIVTRILAGAREFSDPALWDRLNPSFEVYADTVFDSQDDEEIKGPITLLIHIRIDRETIVLKRQVLNFIFRGKRPWEDLTQVEEIRAAASALAPQILTILENAKVEDWRAIADKAIAVCETHLKAIREEIPKAPAEKTATQ